jgi:heat-inducible transcriptional repressor
MTYLSQHAALNGQRTPRQREILRRVVEECVATGQPVGSKGLVERAELDVSPSTVRNDLAELEGFGLLTHPHTSAGRVPTDRGYRLYAGDLLERLEPRPSGDQPFAARRCARLEAVMQQATEISRTRPACSALVSARRSRPPVRHVEVLLLQPQVALVVLIT